MERWYPAAVVAALIGGIFYALHADLPPRTFSAGDYPYSQNVGQVYRGNEDQRGANETVFSGIRLIDIAELVLAVSTVGLWAVTRRSVIFAERSLVDVERAFITAKAFGVHPIVHSNRPIGYRISAVFTNTGRTPALRTVAHFNIVAFEGGPPAGFDFPDRPPRDDVASTTGPNVDLIFPLDIAIEELDDIRDGKKVGLIYGWIEYCDVFANRRRMEASMQIEIVGDYHRMRDRNEPPGATASVLGFRSYGKYNGIDQYCVHQPGQTPLDKGGLPPPRQPRQTMDARI